MITADISQMISTAKEYADLLVKPPLEQLGGLFGETVGYWRLRNQVNVILKAKRFIEESGVKTKELPPSVFVPLIEQASNTDDETLTEMFARLLASHVNSGTQAAHPSFSTVLGQLAPLDVQILNVFDEKEHQEFNAERKKDHKRSHVIWHTFEIIEAVKRSFGEATRAQVIHVSLQNLSRLGLLAQEKYSESRSEWRTSSFGKSFLSACCDPSAYWRNDSADEIHESHRKSKAKDAEFKNFFNELVMPGPDSPVSVLSS